MDCRIVFKKPALQYRKNFALLKYERVCKFGYRPFEELSETSCRGDGTITIWIMPHLPGFNNATTVLFLQSSGDEWLQKSWLNVFKTKKKLGTHCKMTEERIMMFMYNDDVFNVYPYQKKYQNSKSRYEIHWERNWSCIFHDYRRVKRYGLVDTEDA